MAGPFDGYDYRKKKPYPSGYDYESRREAGTPPPIQSTTVGLEAPVIGVRPGGNGPGYGSRITAPSVTGTVPPPPAPSAPEDPITAQADRRALMREVESRRVAAHLQAQTALRQARTPQAGGRLDYGLIHELEQQAAEHARRVNDVRTITRKSTLDQSPAEYDASQQSLAGNYASNYIQHRDPNFVGPLTPALESARGFFQPRQYNDPEIAAKRAALAHDRALNEADPELRAEIARVMEERQMAAAQATMRGNSLQSALTESNAGPELTRQAVDTELARGREMPVVAARQTQLAKERLGKDIIQTGIDTPSLAIANATRNRQISSALKDEAYAQAEFDPKSWSDDFVKMATLSNENLSDMTLRQQGDFEDEFANRVMEPLQRLAKVHPALAAKHARELASSLSVPEGGTFENALALGGDALTWPARAMGLAPGLKPGEAHRKFLSPRTRAAQERITRIKSVLDQYASLDQPEE